jgi:hypothetical protein
MDELIGKLTNLTYELFGVILPGLVMTMFVLAWLWAVGDLAPIASADLIPRFDLQLLRDLLSESTRATMLLPVLAVAYFFGHLLLWIGRSGPTLDPESSKKTSKRMLGCLRFRIPKPAASFDAPLESLFKKVSPKFSDSGEVLEWRQFYPLAKSFVAQRLSYSLIATYQNKYTLHRSITTAATALLWLSVTAAVAGFLTHRMTGVHPSYLGLSALALFSILLIWGFSGSYMLHWKMFGNTIVTESYSLLFGPKDDATTTK